MKRGDRRVASSLFMFIPSVLAAEILEPLLPLVLQHGVRCLGDRTRHQARIQLIEERLNQALAALTQDKAANLTG